MEEDYKMREIEKCKELLKKELNYYEHESILTYLRSLNE